MSAAEKLEANSAPNASEAEQILKAIDKYYTQVTKLELDYVPVEPALIVVHKIPDITLFTETAASMYKIFRRKGAYLKQAEVDALTKSPNPNVYVQREDIPAFTQYVEHMLNEYATNSPMADDQKVTLLRKSTIQIMSDIFEAPTPQNLERGVKAVSNFVYVLMRDPKAYQLLLSLSSHDHYTLQHSSGVATLAIILAKKIGINDEASLIEAGCGGLLHDIGKTKISRDIINKKGPLDEAEWAEMKKHSLYGYEIVKDNPNIGTRAKLAILQHHEDNNGAGYPMGLRHDQVSIFAKIVAVADIFNAITTDRSYSQAKPPFEAFKLIKEKLSHKIDPKLLEAMILIFGGKV